MILHYALHFEKPPKLGKNRYLLNTLSLMKPENLLKIKLQDVNKVMSLIKEAVVEMERQHIY